MLNDPLLLTPEVARTARLTTRTMEALRVSGGGPPFLRIGRAVRYRRSDVEAWLAARVRRSTSERASSERPEREHASGYRALGR